MKRDDALDAGAIPLEGHRIIKKVHFQKHQQTRIVYLSLCVFCAQRHFLLYIFI